MEDNEYGINSLKGFAYQIRVFVYYMIQMKTGSQIEFETLEDVVVNKHNVNESIDKNSTSFKNIISNKNKLIVIQVKQTSLTESIINKIIYNWLLIESSGSSIDEYVLFTDEEYDNNDQIFHNIDVEIFYNEIIKSSKRSDALISRVKQIYINKKDQFISDYNKIKDHYTFISINNIDEIILEKCESLFHREGLSEKKYTLRIKELLNNINAKIIDSIFQKRPFICTLQDMMFLVEDICRRITEDTYIPDFELFKSINEINLNDPQIVNSREYKQLKECSLSNRRIEKHLIYQQYYMDSRYRSLENRKESHIGSLEDLTYENFCDVKESLITNNNDSPIQRLLKTKEKSNDYCQNDQIRHGSCIYLTSDTVDDEKKISWKDE